jgi:hypothetical protein
MLQDFNEIDRYLLDPSHVLSIWMILKTSKNGELKSKIKPFIRKIHWFLKLLPIINLYAHLLNKGIGYQGLIYREAVII